MRRGAYLGIASACAIALASGPSTVRPQERGGTVDTRPGTKEQIARLESLTRGDVSPDKLTVYLRWLADLYIAAGDLDAAQASYQRILVHNPYDLATSNLLAAFHLDHRDDAEAAEQLLAQTLGWAVKVESQPLYLGQTYALHARALSELGRYEDAMTASEEAVKRLDPDAAEDALRTQAASLRALGRHERAAQAYEHLIGVTGGSNADDVNALIAIETEQRGSIDAAEFHARVESAVETARSRRREALRHDGAEMIELVGEGNVRLEGTLRRGRETRAVLFVPDLGGHRSAFTPYAQLLTLDEGYTTLTIDPRAHGDSRCDSLPSFLELPADHRALIPSDVAAAQRYLRDTVKIPADRIAVVVEGAACADVEHAMHGLNLGAIVVHLSPVFDPLDRDVASAIAFRPPRPALIVVSEEDVYAVQSANAMQQARSGDPVTLHTVRSSGHGVTILHQPKNFAWIASWIRRQMD
jgi:tetratricopeptide (TPR) repeat protein